VHIVFRDVRQLEIDDMRDALDIDAARSNVGGNEHSDIAGTKGRARTLALRLGLVAVDSDRRDTAVIQMANDAIYAMLGSGEDEHPTKGGIARN